jgi:aminopeptidase N
VTESDWDHTWLSEGFATYLAHLYDERLLGRDALAEGMRRDRDQVIAYSERRRDAAVVTPASPSLDNILTANSYQKGSWVLHMLRRRLGDDAFFRGLGLYYARFRDGNALTDDFRQVMEEVSKQPLEGFFRQWVYSPGQPSIGGRWSCSAGVVTVTLEQDPPPGDRSDVVLDIGILTDRGAPPRVETVRLAQREQTFTFAADRPPLDIVLDPGTWLLARLAALRHDTR